MYENFYASTGAPMSVGERGHKMGLPLLLVSSAVFALLHIFVACKARCQARRKLCFDKIDLDGVSNGCKLFYFDSCAGFLLFPSLFPVTQLQVLVLIETRKCARLVHLSLKYRF